MKDIILIIILLIVCISSSINDRKIRNRYFEMAKKYGYVRTYWKIWSLRQNHGRKQSIYILIFLFFYDICSVGFVPSH